MMKLRVFAMSFGLFVILTIQSSNAVPAKDIYTAFAQFCKDLNISVGRTNLYQLFTESFKTESDKNDRAVVERNIENILNKHAATIENVYTKAEMKPIVTKYKNAFGGLAEGQIPYLQTLKNRFTGGSLDIDQEE